MKQTAVIKALWNPGWYETDQSLAVGDRQRFWFFQNTPSAGCDKNVDLVFFNQLDSSANCQVRFATVLEIHHDVLGQLSRIDADGLDYVFTPVDGPEIIVNAEEDPGTVYDPEIKIDNWSIIVTLGDVSESICGAT
jgi:hypothetical protein